MKKLFLFLASTITIIVLARFLIEEVSVPAQQVSMKLNNICTHTSKAQAIDTVNNLPEVKEFFSLMKKANVPIVEPTVNINGVWTVHVSEDHPDHLATFNWYNIDECTGKIICSLAIYDKAGKFVRDSSDSECW